MSSVRPAARVQPRLLGFGGALAVCLALAGCAAASDPPSAPPNSVGTTFDRPVPAAVAHLRLVTADGTPTSLANYQGKVVVISDSTTLCQEDCPLDTANLVTAAKAADAAGLTNKVEFLTITVDPARDTPAQLQAYRALYVPRHQLPNWELLTGSPQHLATLWKFLGVYYAKVPSHPPLPRNWRTNQPLTYDVAHSDAVIALDERGHERWVVSGHANVATAAAVPATLRRTLNRSGHRHLNHPTTAAWTAADVLSAVSWLTGHRIPSARAAKD